MRQGTHQVFLHGADGNTEPVGNLLVSLAVQTVEDEYSPRSLGQFGNRALKLPETAARRRLRQLEGAVAELPERTRRIFVLNRLHGETYQEIADRLGVSVSTVQKHLMRALAHAMFRLDS